MANHASAKKKARRIETLTEVNRMRVTRIRTFFRKVEAAILKGNKPAAQEALRLAQPEMMKGAAKGVLHPNMVSRKLSRLSARIKALQG